MTRNASPASSARAKALAALNHPNVATLHGYEKDTSQDGDRHFLVMEPVEGEDLAERHTKNGTNPLGVQAILSQRREDAPRHVKRTYAPPVHAKNPELRQQFLEGFWAFEARFRRASYLLRRGGGEPEFPQGSFAPGLPFVEHEQQPRPG